MFKVKLPRLSKKNRRVKPKVKIINRVILFLAFFLIIITGYNLAFVGKVFPQILVAGVPIGGKNPVQATEILKNSIKIPEKITLIYNEQNFEIASSDLELSYNFETTINAAYSLTRTGNFLYDFAKRFSLLGKPAQLGLRLSFDESKLQTFISTVSDSVSVEPVYPSIKVVGKEIVVDRGKEGRIIDAVGLRTEIGQALAFNKSGPIVVPVKSVNPTLSEEQAQLFSDRAKKLQRKSLVLKFEDQSFVYKENDLFSFLSPDGGYYENRVLLAVSNIVSEVNRLPQEPVFVFENAKVSEFTPAKDGVLVKEDLMRDMIIGNLRSLESDNEDSLRIDIPVERNAPKTATKDINNMGIKELLGKGVSRFAGSIPNRIHNIQLATGKMKGVLIAPGEVFSFNDTLGDVSALTGFKQAYVIKEGKTILGDGGGVCQVSTTLFRAALNAGLPIIERAAHAYRVGYYEQNSAPGFDATVYAPHPDLKIKNDTPGYLLIQPSVDLKNVTLVFEIYGTNDGRVATVSKPAVSNQVAPGEDVYTDDPTLPVGVIKQIEHKAWGARVVFDYQVSRGGETIYKKTFVSNYQPWQAVYLRGTAPAQ